MSSSPKNLEVKQDFAAQLCIGTSKVTVSLNMAIKAKKKVPSPCHRDNSLPQVSHPSVRAWRQQVLKTAASASSMDKATLPESSQTQSPAPVLYTEREDDRERGVLRVFKLLTANPPSSTSAGLEEAHLCLGVCHKLDLAQRQPPKTLLHSAKRYFCAWVMNKKLGKFHSVKEKRLISALIGFSNNSTILSSGQLYSTRHGSSDVWKLSGAGKRLMGRGLF